MRIRVRGRQIGKRPQETLRMRRRARGWRRRARARGPPRLRARGALPLVELSRLGAALKTHCLLQPAGRLEPQRAAGPRGLEGEPLYHGAGLYHTQYLYERHYSMS